MRGLHQLAHVIRANDRAASWHTVCWVCKLCANCVGVHDLLCLAPLCLLCFAPLCGVFSLNPTSRTDREVFSVLLKIVDNYFDDDDGHMNGDDEKADDDQVLLGSAA